MVCLALLWSIVFCSAFICVNTSNGDRHPVYQGCMRLCYWDCQDNPNYRHYEPPLGQLALIYLSCTELCNYGCIDNFSREWASQHTDILKFYGHWPFDRYFGLEEPASVLFSFLNILPHLRYLLRSTLTFNAQKSSAPQRRFYFMEMWLILYSLVAINAWFASTVYHSKKTPTATNYDLISALCLLTMEFFVSIRRVLHHNANSVGVSVLFFGLVVGCSARAYLMVQGRISFSSHMTLCIGIVVVTSAVWTSWSIFGSHSPIELASFPVGDDGTSCSRVAASVIKRTTSKYMDDFADAGMGRDSAYLSRSRGEGQAPVATEASGVLDVDRNLPLNSTDGVETLPRLNSESVRLRRQQYKHQEQEREQQQKHSGSSSTPLLSRDATQAATVAPAQCCPDSSAHHHLSGTHSSAPARVAAAPPPPPTAAASVSSPDGRWNRWRCLCCQFALILASTLEILDFAPIWGIFDAHSLWHCATVPIGFMWYVFWDIDKMSYLTHLC